MTLNKEYWESLDVSIEDLIDNESKLPDVSERLAHKLEDLFGNCISLIKTYYAAKGIDLYNGVYHLFIHSRDDFRELYALATYSEDKVNSEFIMELAKKHLKTGLGNQIFKQTGSSRSLLLPLLKVNPDILYDVHFAHILQCKPVRTFKLSGQFAQPVHFDALDETKIDAILQEFEEKSKAKVKLPSKVWRYKTDGNSALIVYRREKRLRSELNKLAKNEYHKTGNQKIILYKDGGEVLQVCSKDQKIVKTSQFILYKLTNQDLKYKEVISTYKLKKLKTFIDKIVAKQIDECLLSSVRVQNVALQNSSPTIELFCGEDAAPALDDLSNNNGLPLLDKIEELLSFSIRLQDRHYHISTIVDGGDVILLFDNRNIREENKDTLQNFLDKYLR